MRKFKTSDRLKEIMERNKLRQIDILEKVKPYCDRHNVKMNKSDLSQYVSGTVEPGQWKLAILGMALNVNEAWLMGFDVPKERNLVPEKDTNLTSQAKDLLDNFYKLNDLGKKEAAKRVGELTHLPKYKLQDNHLELQAAHEIEGSSKEDKDHDDAVMDDDNF